MRKLTDIKDLVGSNIINSIYLIILPSVLTLINNQIYNTVIYFYIYVVSAYFLNFLFNVFLRKVTDNIRNLFDLVITFINFGKYIFILYLLIFSLK